MQMQDKIIINDYIENDPLSEENLDKTLKTVNKIRLSFPNKSIWIYSGYKFDEIFSDGIYSGVYLTKDCPGWKRREIVKRCTVMIDGKYIDSKRDITMKWAGSTNQRVIDIQKTLQQGEIILWD